MLILLFLYFPILDIILQKEWQIYSLTPFIPNIVCLFVWLFFLNHLSVFITKWVKFVVRIGSVLSWYGFDIPGVNNPAPFLLNRSSFAAIINSPPRSPHCTQTRQVHSSHFFLESILLGIPVLDLVALWTYFKLLFFNLESYFSHSRFWRQQPALSHPHCPQNLDLSSRSWKRLGSATLVWPLAFLSLLR